MMSTSLPLEGRHDGLSLDRRHHARAQGHRLRQLSVSGHVGELSHPPSLAGLAGRVTHLGSLFLDFEPGIHYPQMQMQAGVNGHQYDTHL